VNDELLAALNERENELKALEAQAIHNLGFVQGRLEELQLIRKGIEDGPPEPETCE